MEKQIVVVNEPKKKLNRTFDLTSEFNLFVGQVVKATPNPQRFELLGCEVKVPGNAAGDVKVRCYAAYLGMTRAIFSEAENGEQEFAEGTIQESFVTCINALGMFGQIPKVSRLATETAFARWFKEKSLDKQIQIQSVLTANKCREARITVKAAVVKGLKSDLKQSVTRMILAQPDVKLLTD